LTEKWLAWVRVTAGVPILGIMLELAAFWANEEMNNARTGCFLGKSGTISWNLFGKLTLPPKLEAKLHILVDLTSHFSLIHVWILATR
jgi:hypothetical protein